MGNKYIAMVMTFFFGTNLLLCKNVNHEQKVHFVQLNIIFTGMNMISLRYKVILIRLPLQVKKDYFVSLLVKF